MTDPQHTLTPGDIDQIRTMIRAELRDIRNPTDDAIRIALLTETRDSLIETNAALTESFADAQNAAVDEINRLRAELDRANHDNTQLQNELNSTLDSIELLYAAAAEADTNPITDAIFEKSETAPIYDNTPPTPWADHTEHVHYPPSPTLAAALAEARDIEDDPDRIVRTDSTLTRGGYAATAAASSHLDDQTAAITTAIASAWPEGTVHPHARYIDKTDSPWADDEPLLRNNLKARFAQRINDSARHTPHHSRIPFSDFASRIADTALAAYTNRELHKPETT